MPPKRPAKQNNYKLTRIIQEEHGRPIYNLQFNTCDLRYTHFFATVGSNRATVYECLEEDCNTRVVQAYVDENKNESYFSVVFGVDEEDGTPLLLIAGLTGLIKIIDVHKGRMVRCLSGHGNSINDLKVHPRYPSLVLSASKDDSVRLWNIKTCVLVLIFAGAGGHRNEVLSVDWHPSDDWKFVSCGMDNTIKIWKFSEVEAVCLQSLSWDPASKFSFPTKYRQHPEFSSARVHSNYVDCVRWLGDLVLSKSVDNQILLWRPEDDNKRPKDAVRVVQEYPFQDADIWFIRFALDFKMSRLAVGNRQGKVFVWDANTCPANLIARLNHPTMRLPIRQTAFSFNSRVILCCCEDGTVLRWDDDSEE